MATGIAGRPRKTALFRPNLHTVEVYGNLCIECRACLRRASMNFATVDKAAHRLRFRDNLSDMTDIANLPFRCSCGSTDVAWLIPLNEAEAQRFVAGGNIDTSLISRPPPSGC
jgi:hypothetical protein